MLNYIIWDVNPQIFTIHFFEKDFPLGWYGLLFAVGFFLGQQLLLYIYRKEGKPSSDIDHLTIYVVIATIVGARLGHYLFYEWGLLMEDPKGWFLQMVIPPYSGLASHGGAIGILTALYLYSKRKVDQSFLWVLDRVVIPVSLGGAFIRMGNLMNSEIYGKPTDASWAFVFVQETDPELLPLVPRHPTQIYEAFYCIFLLFITYTLWKNKRTILPDGFIGGIFIILLFAFRFLVEFLKNNQMNFEDVMVLNMGQILSIPAALVGVLILAYAYSSKPKVHL